ncbi:MAG: M1 family aminopeptidase [Ferruginibacter sp.]
MRLYFLLLLSLILSTSTFAQVFDGEPKCSDKCSHANVHLRNPQAASYYQYPSMDKYDVKYLKLDLNVEAGDAFISGTALTVAKVLANLDSFNIELKDNMIVDSVFINGVRKSFSRGPDYVFVPLSPALPAGSTVSALIYYNGTTGSGVYEGTTGSGLTYTATLSESYQAREWYPSKQILKDKIDSADIWVKTDAANKVGSNGKLVAVVVSPNNKKQYQWHSRHPMNYYMPSIAVGNYMEYSIYAKPAAMAPDSVLILNYLPDNVANFNTIKPVIDKTVPFLEKFSELFGLYPFSDEKYGHSQASIGGGMEHQTMTTISSFGSGIVAHELGHQWWGDQVTCATWNHIWVNEGFASYCEYLAIENLPALFPTTTPAAYMQSIHDNVMSSPTGSVYVPDASLFDENRIFSGRLSYNKGEAIIHTLRFEIQDDNLFFQTLKNYQQQFKDSVATADDFRRVAEQTSGKSFTDFFNQWYYGEGYPTFNITYTRQGTDSIILLVNEDVSAPSATPFFKGLYEFKITSAQGDTTVKAYITHNNEEVKFPYNKNPNGVVVDPNNWVINKTGLIIDGGTVVPLQLISFDAIESNCTVTLKWTTNNERQTKQYEVEYSSDGINFTTVTTINSNHSDSQSLYQYNYLLGNGAVHYFRLKMVNENDSYTFSQQIKIDKSCNKPFSVHVNPNPVSENMVATINIPVAGSTNLRILNHAGALLYKETRMLNGGENKVEINFAKKLPKGAYILRTENDHVIITTRFVKS